MLMFLSAETCDFITSSTMDSFAFLHLRYVTQSTETHLAEK